MILIGRDSVTRLVLEIPIFWRNEITKLREITRMKQIQMFLLLAVLIFAVTTLGQETKSAAGTVFRDCPDCPKNAAVKMRAYL